VPGAQRGKPTAPTLSAVTGLPRSARLVCWFNAWLPGHCSLDDARDAVVGGDAAHEVLGLDDEPLPLVFAFARLRDRGAGAATLSLPVPGDPVGLAGPAELNALAIEAGEAAVVNGAGVALVPAVVGAGVSWRAVAATDVRTVPDLGEADRQLRETLLETSARLADLDVARWRPEAAEGLHALRDIRPAPLAPGQSPEAQRLAALGLRCQAIAELGLDDDGAAVSAYEASERRDALLRLSHSARHALVAACSASGGVQTARR